MSYAESIAQRTVQWMARNEKAILMGVGVTDAKGIFGTTAAARKAFPRRVIETPLSENMLTGSLIGLAQNGYNPLLVHARSDFMTLSMEHIVNSIAKWQYMDAEKKALGIGIRCIIGQGWGNGPQHTQSTAHWFSGMPGAETFMPVSEIGIKTAFDNIDHYPTLIYEHRRLYGSKLESPWTEFGENPTVLFIAFSATVLDAQKAAKKLLDHRGISSRVYAIENVSRMGLPPDEEVEGCKLTVVTDVAPSRGGLADDVARQVELKRISGYWKTNFTSIIRPPHCPVPASEYLERLWYPSAHYIASRVTSYFDVPEIESVRDHNFKPIGGPF
jgi:pyruvate/2-oxoglutarate/acetoin dehydrogenase E1 component